MVTLTDGRKSTPESADTSSVEIIPKLGNLVLITDSPGFVVRTFAPATGVQIPMGSIRVGPGPCVRDPPRYGQREVVYSPCFIGRNAPRSVQAAPSGFGRVASRFPCRCLSSASDASGLFSFPELRIGGQPMAPLTAFFQTPLATVVSSLSWSASLVFFAKRRSLTCAGQLPRARGAVGCFPDLFH